jgi:hypothetical protein
MITNVPINIRYMYQHKELLSHILNLVKKLLNLKF